MIESIVQIVLFVSIVRKPNVFIDFEFLRDVIVCVLRVVTLFVTLPITAKSFCCLQRPKL